MIDPLDNLTSTEQLRRLLLREEQERLDRLEARLGDEGALKNSLVPLIADILRDAGVKDHRRLAGALAPIVLQSIKTEIHNSRDMMVDALYPITGRLVAAAVRNAFRDLVDQLNDKMDKSLSIDRWRAKFKAKISGRSEAEILLSEGAAFEIVDLLLINRQSGLLIAKAGPDPESGGMDSHLLSSILTAIMAFVRDAMSQSSEQDLRTLHVGDMRLHLQVSPGAILAIKTKGPPPAGFDTALSETFYAFLSKWGGTLSDPDQIEAADERALTEDLEARFQSLLEAKRSNFRGVSNKGAIALALLASIATLWIGWSFYDKWSSDRIEAEARSVIAGRSELNGYPINANYHRADDILTVSGLLPDQEAIAALRREFEITFPDLPVTLDVSSLPDGTPGSQNIPTAANSLEWRQALRNDLIKAVDDRISTLSETISGLEARLPTPEDAERTTFEAWLDRRSLRFGEDNKLEDEVAADGVLRELTDRLSALPGDVGLRIVGYSDDLGEDQESAWVSLLRAALIGERLRDLGVPAERLDVVGRGSENRIGDVGGSGSVNRRVEFEMTYRSDQEIPDSPQRDTEHGTR